MGQFNSERRRALLMLLASAGALMLPQDSWSQDFDVASEVGRVRESVAAELATPLARLGLLEFAGWFRFARIQARPLGYEADEQYKSGSDIVLSTLNTIVPTLKASEINSPSNQFITDITTAYKRNVSSLNTVFGAVRSVASPLSTLSDTQFLHFQLVVALILQGVRSDIFTLASRITFIYPFC